MSPGGWFLTEEVTFPGLCLTSPNSYTWERSLGEGEGRRREEKITVKYTVGSKF